MFPALQGGGKFDFPGSRGTRFVITLQAAAPLSQIACGDDWRTAVASGFAFRDAATVGRG